MKFSLFYTCRRCILFFGFFFLLQNIALAQKFDFRSSELPRFRNGKSIVCLNNSTVVAVGGWLKNDSLTGIYRSTDTGKTWNIVSDQFGGMLQHVASPDFNTLFAVGRSGTFAKSTDAGITWNIQQVNNFTTTEFTCCHFINTNLGFVSGYNEYIRKSVVLKTFNGGNTWTILADTFTQKINAIRAIDSLNLVFSGNNGNLYFTNNSGKTWNASSLLSNTANNHLFTIEILPNNHILIAGGKSLPDSNQILIKSTDLGAHFETLINQPNYCIHSLKFTGGLLYGAGEKGQFFISKDTGKTLNFIEIPNNNSDGRDFYGISVFNPGMGSICGLYGRTVHFKNLDYQLPKLEFNEVKISKKHQVKFYFSVEPRGQNTTLFLHIGNDKTSLKKKKINDFSGYNTYNQNLLDTLTPGFYFAKLELVYNGTSIFSSLKTINLNFFDSLNLNFENWDSTRLETLQSWNTAGEVTLLQTPQHSVKIRAKNTSEPGAIYIADINNDVISGGTPFQGQPDTLFVKGSYQINKNDSAHVQLWFKNKGQIFYAVACKWTGSANNITLSFPLNFPKSTLPDSLVIACLSTNFFGGNIDTLSTLWLDSIWFSGKNNLIPNPGFHLWNIQTTYQPIFWHANNPPSRQQKNIFPTKGIYYNTKALQMFADPQSASNTQLILGHMQNNLPFQMKPAMKVNQNYSSLKGYYQFSQATANDTFQMEVFAFKDTLLIGTSRKIITDSTQSWTAFDLPIDYIDTSKATGINLVFSLKSKPNNSNMSKQWFKLDELSFDNFIDTAFSAKRKYFLENPTIAIYPNPNQGIFTVTTAENNPISQITLYNAVGKPVWFTNNTALNPNSQTLQTNFLPAGIYIICVQTAQQKFTQTIVIQQ